MVFTLGKISFVLYSLIIVDQSLELIQLFCIKMIPFFGKFAHTPAALNNTWKLVLRSSTPTSPQELRAELVRNQGYRYSFGYSDSLARAAVSNSFGVTMGQR